MSEFKFIDLFAGIGGMHLAFEAVGGECVFSSEWDSYAQQTYEANFGEKPAGDITKIPSKDIPNHDVLVAGFPCQPFSIAGVSKKNSLNRPHGFLDKTQGTLFFDVARIIRDKKPQAFLLENVKNLKSHDGGNTFRIIKSTLEKDLGYYIWDEVIDAKYFVPQHRERVFIVGFKDPVPFEFPEIARDVRQKLRDILEKKANQKYTLSNKLWTYLQNYARKHKAAGNGFGFGLADRKGITRTLSARYYKDGSEILIPQRNKSPRRLTPRECARLMGFPDDFKIVVSDTRAYKQFGNAVVVPVVESIAREMVKCLDKTEETQVCIDIQTKKPRKSFVNV
ncbi:MAG: DNA (cytosine-5-)-methyltransferase [Candidatus Margulisiibacteriota bacterium]